MSAPAGFLAAMAQAGIVCAEPHRLAADGALVRFHVEGDRAGSRNGWAVLYGDGRAAGAFGHWRSGTAGTWSDERAARLNRSERAHALALVEQARRARTAEREAGHVAAAERAAIAWQHAEPANADHPYLRRKRVGAHGIRQQGTALLIPARDATGRLWSLESIYPDGGKRFLRGGRKAGCFHVLGEVEDRCAIAEGYASAASIFEAAGWPCACAFDAGNLPAVALALRQLHPAADLVVFADNDPAGITKGKEAARLARARFTVARLKGEPLNDGH